MERISIRKAKNAIPGLMDMIQFIDKQTKVENLTMAEIGCYTGDSTYQFAKRFKFVNCIDPWKNHYDDEHDDSSYKYDMTIIESQFDDYLKEFENKIKKYKMTSIEASQLFDNNSLDLVYIDGNHQKEFVKEDISLWMPKVKKGGWLAGHDYGSKHHVDIKPLIDSIFNKHQLYTFNDTSWLIKL